MEGCRICKREINPKYLFCYRCDVSTKTYKDCRGYVRFKNSGYLLHRYVAEKNLGRKLKPDEVVHHKNRNKSDNKFSNLWVFRNQTAHDNVHKRDALKYGEAASYQGFGKFRSD